MNILKKAVYTDKSLHSGALYSQAVITGDWVFVSGQVPIEPETRALSGKTIYEQSVAVLGFIQSILAESDCTMDDIVKMNCFLTDLNSFAEMNRAFELYFKKPYPARATVGVQLIGFDVEMDCIARKGASKGK